jgi:molybdate transport system substrate-binding protein
MIICALYYSACTQQSEETQKNYKYITVCAAASLRDVLNEIQPKFEQDTGIRLTLNFASSGALQKQIEEGAPADVFISAGKKQMDILESNNLIDKESRKNLIGNKLVLIVPNEYKNKIKTIFDLVDKDVIISIGEPNSVPAGQYAKESIEYFDLWDKLESKIVYAKDVRQVVAYVETGEVAAGVVYNSDAIVLKKSTVVQVFDEEAHEPIVYPGAIISASKEKESAKAFLDYLNNDTAGQIFENYRFETNIK